MTSLPVKRTVIWKLWKKDKLNSETICKLWKKGKLNSEKIWKIQKKMMERLNLKIN